MAIAPLRVLEINLNASLNDWLIGVDSRREVIQRAETVISHLASLEFNLKLRGGCFMVPSH